MIIWYIFPVLVCCAKKNLATLHPRMIGFEVQPMVLSNIGLEVSVLEASTFFISFFARFSASLNQGSMT
jgi:hypothetical protein